MGLPLFLCLIDSVYQKLWNTFLRSIHKKLKYCTLINRQKCEIMISGINYFVRKRSFRRRNGETMERILTKEEFKKKRRKIKYIKLGIICTAALAVVMVIIVLIFSAVSSLFGKGSGNARVEALKKQVAVKEKLLSKNEYSRPEIKLDAVKGIVIHYTGSSGTTAEGRRDYFENLNQDSGAAQSSHFIVGLSGEIIQCIPTDEIAYASLSRNSDTIAIEYCHNTEDGAIGDSTYDSLVKLTAWLMESYGLKSTNIIRHYDINSIECPKYFVENQEVWTKFLKDVQETAEKAGTSK